MEDFVVNSELNGNSKWYMHIGFKDMSTHFNHVKNCVGSVLIRTVDDDNEYWFCYSFKHSIDWISVGTMMIQPVKEYLFTNELMMKIGAEVFYNIKAFITRMN